MANGFRVGHDPRPRPPFSTLVRVTAIPYFSGRAILGPCRGSITCRVMLAQTGSPTYSRRSRPDTISSTISRASGSIGGGSVA